jgi:large subunit ribosomal protein L22
MAKAAEPTYKAGAKFVRISPYKVREVAAIIKGKHVDEARRILAFTPKAASFEFSKILESAIANAEHNFEVPQEELYIKFVSADEGVTIKRFRPRAQGRGFRIRKRTSHINLELERRQPEPVATPRRATRRATGAAKGGSGGAAATGAAARSGGGAKATGTKATGTKATGTKATGTKTAAAKKPTAAAKPKAESKASTTEKKAPAKRTPKTKEGN